MGGVGDKNNSELVALLENPDKDPPKSKLHERVCCYMDETGCIITVEGLGKDGMVN